MDWAIKYENRRWFDMRCDFVSKNIRSNAIIVELKVNKKIILFGVWQPAVYKIFPDVSEWPTISILVEAVRFSNALESF
jgi:hypothetical protein